MSPKTTKKYSLRCLFYTLNVQKNKSIIHVFKTALYGILIFYFKIFKARFKSPVVSFLSPLHFFTYAAENNFHLLLFELSFLKTILSSYVKEIY